MIYRKPSCYVMGTISEIALTDVLQHKEDGIFHCAPPIEVYTEAIEHTSADGIMVGFAGQEVQEYRIVIENKEGQLYAHVWATAESIGNDPTHSILIEKGT